MFKDFLYMFFMFSAVLQGPESVCRYRSVCVCVGILVNLR